MDVYMTIYRGETAEDEIEINITAHYDKDENELEVLEVTNTFDNTPVKLTDKERYKVVTVEFDEWLEDRAFFDGSLYDRVGQWRKVYWAEVEPKQCQLRCNCLSCTQARLGRPPFNESTSSKIVRALNIHANGGNS